MLISNQLRKDLEGFLEDLYSNRQLSAELKEEDLVAKVSPKIDEFLSFYNSPLYNQERIQQLGNSLRKNIHNYAKVDADFKKYVAKIEEKRELRGILLGAWYYLFGGVLTGNTPLGIISFIIGYTFGKIKRIPITEEYTELETKRKQKIEEMLN